MINLFSEFKVDQTVRQTCINPDVVAFITSQVALSAKLQLVDSAPIIISSGGTLTAM
jgi:hypothetical protein